MGKGSGRRPLLISEQEAQDNWDKIFKKNKNSDDVSPHAYEYELNKSTGNVEKRFLDGINKPNEEQFNGNVTNTSSLSKNEEGQLPSGADS
jgi:hypothetical protein